MPTAPVLSSDFQKTTLASETDEVVVVLLEISHPDLVDPIRVSSDMAEIYGYDEESGDPIYVTYHQGKEYFSAPFSFVPPGSPDADTIPKSKLVLANVDRRVIQAIRDIHSQCQVKATLVYASDPDEIISDIPQMWLESVDYDAASITATLGLKHFLLAKVPRITFAPAWFPAIFKGGVSNT